VKTGDRNDRPDDFSLHDPKEVAADLVKLLARVPHDPAGLAHVLELQSELWQRKLAACYLLPGGHVFSSLRLFDPKESMTRSEGARPPAF
jgi:hypothetical protein